VTVTWGVIWAIWATWVVIKHHEAECGAVNGFGRLYMISGFSSVALQGLGVSSTASIVAPYSGCIVYSSITDSRLADLFDYRPLNPKPSLKQRSLEAWLFRSSDSAQKLLDCP